MKIFDVSEFQALGIVKHLVEEGAEGVIVKLGETVNGIPELDPKFIEHVNAVVAEGLPYGIYFVTHAHSNEEAIAEAQWINDKVYEYLNGTEPALGVWLDAEVDSVKTTNTHGYLIAAINKMTEWGFKNVGIYAGYSFFISYLHLEELGQKNIPIWVAQYGYYENSLKSEYPNMNHVAWQYTETYNNENLDCSEWY